MPEDPLQFVRDFSLTCSFLLCYGIGVFANAYSFERALCDVPASQSLLWRRALVTTNLASIFVLVVGIVVGAAWRGWDWDVNEIGVPVLCGWQIVYVFVLGRSSARWLICGGIVTAILATYAWFPANLPAVGAVAAIQLPALVLVLAPKRFLGKLWDLWANRSSE